MLGIAIAHTQKENFLQQWEYVLSNFKPDVVYVYGGKGKVLESAVLDSAILIDNSSALPETSTLVVLAPTNGQNVQGVTNLYDFVHPDDAIYWFGSDSRHLDADLFVERAADCLVYIPTDTSDQMYSFLAYGVTAWDRKCKG